MCVWGGLVSLCFAQGQDMQYILRNENDEATYRPGQDNCRGETFGCLKIHIAAAQPFQ